MFHRILVLCNFVELAYNEETISALRMVKDAIRLFGEGHAFNIPVTDAVRHSARAAHQKYKEAQQFSFATRKC